MVIFEDLHWIDEQTQELLNLLADSIGTAKILLLVNYRPEYSHQWNSKTYYTQLRLDPLGKESAEEMLSALLGDGKDLLPLKRLIIERTEGTPFFMEEMVQALFEDGVLQRNGTVKLAKSMNAVKVPATVQAMLASRIDRLPAEEKELLQTLAVLGREFPLGLVQRVTLKPDDELERMLSRPAAGGVHLRATGGRRCRVHLQACADAGGRLQLAAGRAPQALARARRSWRWSRCSPSSWTIIWTSWRIITAAAITSPRRSSIWGGRASRRCSALPMLMRSVVSVRR